MTEREQSHVLIVEDNELVSGALQILFESADRRVSVASSLAQTVATAQADPPRLVLLDLKLPDGDGLTIVDALRAAGCAFIVALTGRDDPDTRARCLAAGCTDVLVKPVPVRELISKSADWLD